MSSPQSTAESAMSSLQRSGLSITVGDTKSIVLALQALQSKIRSLEQDRDFHQDQYEMALQAHDRYKLDMERQMEQERAAHHKRETDLLELLRKAREERSQLENALNNSKGDIGGFRQELEQMIVAEKELSSQRESKINAEVNKLRADIKEEQTRRAALLVTVDKVKEEREAVVKMNEQLRATMDDLLSRYEQLQRRRLAPQAAPRQFSKGGARGGARPSAAPATGAYSRRSASSRIRSSGCASPCELQGHSLPERQCRGHSALHRNYEDPTCNSILRDVRVVPEEAPPCAYPSVSSSMHQSQQDTSQTIAKGKVVSSGRGLRAQTGATTSPSARVSPARRQPEVNVTDTSTVRRTAIDEVEAQLREELETLQRRYDDTIQRGASEEVPREVLAAALQRISALVDQKKEQLKLLKEARMELDEAAVYKGIKSVAASGMGSGGGGGPLSPPLTQDKHTRRTMLVNELRSLLAEAAAGN